MSARARIAVCDDDPDLRDLLVDLPRRDGYEAEAAEDGVALRWIVPKIRPDLAICDLMLPGEDGLSLRGEGYMLVPGGE